MPSTPCFALSAITSGSSWHGSGRFCGSSWPQSSASPKPHQWEPWRKTEFFTGDYLLLCFDLDEKHCRACSGLCDCSSINKIVLVGLHVGFYELRRNDPNGVPHCARCLIPDFDGAIFSQEWKEAGPSSPWERYYDSGGPSSDTTVDCRFSIRRVDVKRFKPST